MTKEYIIDYINTDGDVKQYRCHAINKTEAIELFNNDIEDNNNVINMYKL